MTEHKFTARDIPEDIAALLQEAAGLGDKAAWQVGRLTDALIDDLKAEGVEFSVLSLYKAVAAHAGCSSETVRMRRHVAHYFPEWIPSKYPWLSFHQAKALVPFGRGDAEKYEALVQEWEQHSETTQISVTSVDGIRAWLHQEEGGPSPELVRYRRMVVQMYKVIANDATPGGIVAVLRNALQDLKYTAQQQELPEWAPEEL